jgi:CRISPR-associated endonuclease/helicase Cas3
MDKPLVTSLKDCWAREGQWLEAHLVEVASAAGRADGTLHEQLSFLAGLLHDVGKARPTWQDYLERSLREEKVETVPHAYLGAALFALYAQGLLRDEPDLVQHYLLLVQDLQDHHGALRDRIKPPTEVIIPWQESMKRHPPQDAFYTDLDDLVHRFFPSLSLSVHSFEAFTYHLKGLETSWKRRVNLQGMRLRQVTKGSAAAYALWTCRDVTGRLIAADRLSASVHEPHQTTLMPERAGEALATFKTTLDEKYQKALKEGHGVMADKRRRVHEQALEAYLKNPETPWFALNLPVGWGKTLISLRVALESAAAGQSERIVYVAPYLAILTQAAKEIREATGLEVLEHHHLALLSEASEEREPVDILTMESWRAPIVATTFNQLFRAIFPATAQQSIRIPALERAFILVDEPQIISAEVYNAFLRGLDVLRKRSRAQVMLVTATLPPTEHGLSQALYDLTPPVESADRYTLIAHAEPWTEKQLVKRTLERFDKHQQVAVILNTIADAVTTYQRVREALPEAAREGCFNLHGMMTPLHKTHVIASVAERLKAGKPVLIVSTQVLEAGVDLSFRCLLRARPILSSVAQAAGRGNRHAEGGTALVEVFDFLRDSGKDARKIIYRNEQQRRVTDELLPAGQWSEAETEALVKAYFAKLSFVDANLAVLERFKRAAEGQWRALASLTPFATPEDDDGNEFRTEFNASVFVATGNAWLTESIRVWMHHFGALRIHEVYERYQDKRSLMQLDFDERKRLISLVRQFAAPLRWRLVPQVCGRVDFEKQSILRALDDSAYHLDTGFGHLLSRTDFDDFELRLEARMSREHHEDFL